MVKPFRWVICNINSYIGCGRKNYGIGGGCIDGSEGAAITHYEETGQIYPLAVKLSTITPTFAEVYSYAKVLRVCI